MVGYSALKLIENVWQYNKQGIGLLPPCRLAEERTYTVFSRAAFFSRVNLTRLSLLLT